MLDDCQAVIVDSCSYGTHKTDNVIVISMPG